MAAQRTQRYLGKHKIGPLFESLMAQLIQDTPGDPISYIIKVLQGMQKKQRIFNDLNGDNLVEPKISSRKSTERSSYDDRNEVNPRHSNLAASWSVGERPKSQDHRRPRTSNRKSTEINTWSPEQLSRQMRGDQSQPTWNNDTRVPTHDFDEWLQLQNEEEKPSDNDVQQERYRGVKSWDVQDRSVQKSKLEEKDIRFSGADELNNELNLGKYQKSSSVNIEENRSSVSPVPIARSRPTKAKRAVEEHRQQLQALLLEGSENGVKELRSSKYSPDEGMDILENMEELQQEGVEKTVNKGAKLNKLKQKQENVSVTICARCARIIAGPEVNSSSDVGSLFNENRGLFLDRVTWKEDDLVDNFETASETSEHLGTSRRSQWPIASDTESDITPRKGTMPKRANSSFGKQTRSFDRREKTSSPLPSSRPSTSRSEVSDGFLNKPRKSWAVNGYSSDNETEVETTRPRTPRSMSGQPWNIPSDDNSDNDSKLSRAGKSKGFPTKKKSTKDRRSRPFAVDTASSVGDTDY